MQTDNTTHTFNLKAVLKQTGIKADTLRAWERRYGLPQPERSAGGHRLFSQRDIDTIKWLMARQEEGLSISNAVDLWNNLKAEGNDPLLMPEYRYRGAPRTPSAVPGGKGLEDLRHVWVSACVAFDEQAAEQIISEAFALHPVEDVCTGIILAGMHEIGEGWYQDQVSVDQEHFASEIARRQLEVLISSAPGPTRPGTVLIGAPPDEYHDLMLLMIALILRRRGWDVTFLGANVPLFSYEKLLVPSSFDLVILSAQQLHSAAALLQVARLAERSGVKLAYGGRIFQLQPELQELIPGAYLGDEMDSLPRMIEQIISSPDGYRASAVPTEQYRKMYEAFQSRSPQIETDIRQRLEASIPAGALETANYNFVKVIEAALRLGNLQYANQEITWIKGLLESREIPGYMLGQYLDAAQDAIKANMGEAGRPIAEWLEQAAS